MPPAHPSFHFHSIAGASTSAGGAGGGVNGVGGGGGAIISLPRACAWCGRGGNLHLAAADPNCRCQQDSVLFASLHQRGAPDASLSADVENCSSNGQRNQIISKQMKSKTSQRQRKAASVTPTRLGMSPIADGGEPHSPNADPAAEEDVANLESARPLSANVAQHCLVPSPYRPNVHHRKLLRKSAIASSSSTSAHPPDSVFNPQQNLFRTQHISGLLGSLPSSLQDGASPWQALSSSTVAPSSIQELFYSPLHPLYQHPQQQQQRQLVLVKPSSYRHIRSGGRCGMRGGMYISGKIGPVGGGGVLRDSLAPQKSAPSVSGSMKLWSNMGFVDPHEQWHSPLSVVAQRRARLKQPK
ncbi:hypothetical protein PoB_004189600 [Plakobranchus ocellatus]|uniref:Uncharacterized protein n=1 Tax=Plakobranchus ocellatus TaxID=259542 RepID=A0AAV4B987_9GAST|nr:hypothetical protein PoB_004189600 [Plakobranchus ocellatus]